MVVVGLMVVEVAMTVVGLIRISVNMNHYILLNKRLEGQPSARVE